MGYYKRRVKTLEQLLATPGVFKHGKYTIGWKNSTTEIIRSMYPYLGKEVTLHTEELVCTDGWYWEEWMLLPDKRISYADFKWE